MQLQLPVGKWQKPPARYFLNPQRRRRWITVMSRWRILRSQPTTEVRMDGCASRRKDGQSTPLLDVLTYRRPTNALPLSGPCVCDSHAVVRHNNWKQATRRTHFCSSDTRGARGVVERMGDGAISPPLNFLAVGKLPDDFLIAKKNFRSKVQK